MIGWIILAVYVIGYVLTWRRVVWAVMIDTSYGDKLDGEDVAFGIAFGSIANCIWPLIALCLSVRAVYQARGDDALYAVMPRHIRRERELADRESRIRELEIANGMDPKTGKFRATV